MSKRTLFLAGLSALELWTAAALGRISWPKPSRATSLRQCAASLDDIRKHDVGRFGVNPTTLDVLVSPEGTNRRSGSIRRRRASNAYPQRSFYRAANHLMVCRPELCLAQIASAFSEVELALFGFELCGSFAINRATGKLIDRRPISSARCLQDYARALGNTPGANKVRKAAKLVLDGSYSPMESRIALELSAPRCTGGFGFPPPTLNKPVDLSEKFEKDAVVRKGDLLWEKQGVVIEYDSSEHHEGEPCIDRDARRRNEFVGRRYRVLTLTKQQAYDLAAMENVAKNLERLLGIRLRSRTSNLEQRRESLHRALYAESDSSPRPFIAPHGLPWQ